MVYDKGVNDFSKSLNSPVSLALLYNNLGVVISTKAEIQVEKTGFRIKSGMTKL